MTSLVGAGPGTILKLTAKSDPLTTCRSLTHVIRDRRVSMSRIRNFTLSRCLKLPLSRPRSCRSAVRHAIIRPLKLGPSLIRIPNSILSKTPLDSNRHVTTTNPTCSETVRRTNNVSIRVLNVNASKRINFGRPKSSLTSNAHIGALIRRAHVSGTQFFSSSVGGIPARYVARNVNAVLGTHRLILLTFKSNGTRTITRAIRNNIDTFYPTSTLRVRPRTAVVISRRTTDHLHRGSCCHCTCTRGPT